MIVKVSPVASKKHAAYLGSHLVNAKDNEACQVWEIDGSRPDDLKKSLMDFYEQCELTKGKTGLVSIAIMPDKGEKMSKANFYKAIEKAEKTYNLAGQNRAIVYHEKLGQDGKISRHVHAVWQTTDSELKKNVANLYYYKKSANTLGRELEQDFKQKAVTSEKSKTSYTKAEHSQSKRANDRSPDRRKSTLQSIFKKATSPEDFIKQAKLLGYTLAEGVKGKCLVKGGQVFNLCKDLKLKNEGQLKQYFLTVKEKIPDAAAVQLEQKQAMTKEAEKDAERAKKAQLFADNRGPTLSKPEGKTLDQSQKKADYLMLEHTVKDKAIANAEITNWQKPAIEQDNQLELSRDLFRKNSL